MKKQLLFLAGSAIILASCGSNNNAENAVQKTQHEIDSAVSAGAAAKEAAIKAANDSTIVATAKAKADSEAIAKEAVDKDHAKHGGGTAKHTTTTKKETTPPPPEAPANPKAARFDEKAAKQQTETNSKAKADRFK